MEPPSGLINKLQAILVDFWGGTDYIPQVVLFSLRKKAGKIWYILTVCAAFAAADLLGLRSVRYIKYNF